MSNVKMKNTLKGNSYWNDTGAYNELQKEYFDKLVPSSGEANTIHGEVLRCANRIYYEYFNNGNGNARNEIYDDSCTGYCNDDEDNYECYCGDEYEVEVNDGFLEYLETIEKIVNTDVIRNINKQIVDIILENRRFDDNSVNVYDQLIDNVMYYILTTENKPRTISN